MSNEKILIVEDDEDLRHGLGLRLRSLGYQVCTAEDGVGAVSVAQREEPDLVLLDIGLPGGDGISVLERYAHLAPLSQTPVVVLTGRDPHTTEPEVRRHHVAAFLRKPADNDQLSAAIASALHGPDSDPAVGDEAPTQGDEPGPSGWFG